MGSIHDILISGLKPKEKVALAAEGVKAEPVLFNELMFLLETGSDVIKGTCADVMKHVTEDHPEIAEPYIDRIIPYINHKTPRVKWGVPESIGNIAKRNPQIVEPAIPYLLNNSIENKENSTVIRWCAAYALSEIVKSSGSKELEEIVESIARTETNNGVKNVYLKAMKYLKKKNI
jgi:hypothetical protein